jgi:hypothetical protein
MSSQVLSFPVRPSSEFNPIKENAQPARCDECCDEVMNVALIVFSAMATVAFISCLTAAVILSSAALGTAAGIVALIALTILLPSAFIIRPAHSGYVDIHNATPYGYPYEYQEPIHFNVQPSYQPSTPRRDVVPQRSPSKAHVRVPSAPVHVPRGMPAMHAPQHYNQPTATVAGHVIPGQRRS